MKRNWYLIRLTGTTMLGVLCIGASIGIAGEIATSIRQYPPVNAGDWIGVFSAALLGVVPLVLGIAFLYNSIHTRNTECRKRLKRERRCPDCGYNLRGSEKNEPGCPECGWGRGE